MMRIFVTGHNGYIGTVLMPMLISEGHDVMGYDSDLYGRCTFGDVYSPVSGIYKDIRDVEFADLAGFDAVIHLGCSIQ
jgi:nucleoside-diphosphate-sugar epimerase